MVKYTQFKCNYIKPNNINLLTSWCKVQRVHGPHDSGSCKPDTLLPKVHCLLGNMSYRHTEPDVSCYPRKKEGKVVIAISIHYMSDEFKFKYYIYTRNNNSSPLITK